MDRRRAIVLTTSCLAGCGGGEGNPDQPPPSRFVVDAVFPQNGSTGASRSAPIGVVFNSTIDAGSVTGESLQLLGPEGNAIAGTVTAMGTTLHFLPKGDLSGDTQFTLHIAESLADTTGRRIPAATRTGFTTAPQAWADGATIVDSINSLVALTSPCVVALQSGGFALAWRDLVGGLDTIFASMYDSKFDAWSVPTMLYAGKPGSRIHGSPSAAAGPNGDVLLFWGESSADGQVQGARYAAAADRWALTGSVQAAPIFAFASQPLSAVDSRGNIVLVCNATGGLYATRYDVVRNQWDTPRRINTPMEHDYVLAPCLAVDAFDAVVAAWIQQDDLLSRSVYVARFDPATGAWSAPQRAGTRALQYLAMAVDGAGAITVAWATEGTSLSAPALLVSRCSFAASSWTAQARLDQASNSGVGPPVVAADAAGHVTVAWVQERAPNACRYDPTTGSWSAPERLSVAMQDGLTGLGIGVDVAGNVTLALTGDPSNMQAALRFSASDRKWSAARAVVSPSTVNDLYANQPAAAVAPSGEVVLAWFAWLNPGPAGRYAVQANRFR